MKFLKHPLSLTTIILTLFTSCQKAKISTNGYFITKSKIPVSRSIASIQNIPSRVDAKQVLIYCLNKMNNTKKCFNLQAKRFKLNAYNSNFHKTQKELKGLTKDYLKNIENNLNKLISKREKFCNKNSLYNYTRCLKMNSLKTTMKLLNESQKKSNINSNEYLYLKREIKTLLDKKFEEKILARLSK